MMYLYIAIALLVGLLLGKALFGKKAAAPTPCLLYTSPSRLLWRQPLPPRRRTKTRSLPLSPPLPL